MEHVDGLSIMGFYEVLKEIPRMWLIMKKTIGLIKKVKARRIILIDYPGFNLKLAKKIHHLKNSHHIFYFATGLGMEEK